jgi:hypothetical protein
VSLLQTWTISWLIFTDCEISSKNFFFLFIFTDYQIPFDERAPSQTFLGEQNVT